MLNFSAKKISAQWHTSLMITRAAAICCLLTLILHGGCKFPTEDPGALNSVQNYSTLQVRFVNLAADKSPRTFTAEYFAAGPVQVPMVQYGDKPSIANTPRFDSARVLVPVASDTNSRDTTVVRFTGRNLVYTLIALPQLRPSSGSIEIVNPNAQTKEVRVPELGSTLRAVDTVLALSASQDVIPAGFVRLRAVNCVYDSRHRFDLTVGCPSGEVIASGLPYRQASSYITTAAPSGTDSLTVSLITKPTTATVSGSTTPTSTLVIGSFKIPVKSGQSYSILIYPNSKANIALLPIHDLRSETIPALDGTAPSARLRVVNVSGTAPSGFFYRVNGKDTAISLRPSKDSASAFAELIACQSVGRDTIVTTIVKNMITSRVNAIGALNAGKSYTLLVGKNSRSEVLTLLAPVLDGTVTAGKARLRFVNFTPQPLFVMRGTTTGASNDALFSSLPTGVLTDTMIVNAGNLPLLLFNTTQPTQLLQTGIGTIAGRKSYIVIFTAGANAGDPPRISLVEDSRDVQGAASIPVMPQGAFVQFMNARADGRTESLDFGTSPNYISNVSLFYGTPQMTVLAATEYSVQNPANVKPFTVKNDEKYVLIFSENTMLQLDIERGLRDTATWKDFSTRTTGRRDALTLEQFKTASQFRFVNASPDFGRLVVMPDARNGFYVDSTDTAKGYRPPTYREATFSQSFNQGRQYSLTFKALGNSTNTVTLRNITLNLNRAYTIIFSGRTTRASTKDSAAVHNYNAIILQEY